MTEEEERLLQNYVTATVVLGQDLDRIKTNYKEILSGQPLFAVRSVLHRIIWAPDIYFLEAQVHVGYEMPRTKVTLYLEYPVEGRNGLVLDHMRDPLFERLNDNQIRGMNGEVHQFVLCYDREGARPTVRALDVDRLHNLRARPNNE